ncbi:MAG: MBL fold metallo-hydrolase [Ignavibacteria bacterium]|nr:MBL fold metallo-hydrolase [Ignavibacteria bacterium]
MIKIGNYSVDVIESGRFGLDGGAMFGVVPKALWERSYTKADEKNRIPMAAKALLLRDGTNTILVDTGNSPFMSEKEQSIYGISFDQFSIERSLAGLGISAHDVTHVLLTHLHFDHVGGAVVTNDDGLFPRFTNARYIVQTEHFQYAQDATPKDRASFIASMFMPLEEHKVLDLVEGETEVFDGIFVERVYGHTKAMQTVRITSGNKTLFYPADLMPTGAHVPIAYGMAYDNFPLTTLLEKQKYLPRIIEEEWIVVFEHDALRQAARIVQGVKGPQLSDDIIITEYDN